INSVQRSLLSGISLQEVYEASAIDPWFLDQIMLINEIANEVKIANELDFDLLKYAKSHGFSDFQIAQIRNTTEDEIRKFRINLNLRPVYKTVDTCAAEFEAKTPYHYSSYDQETEVAKSNKNKVIILGSGPNRIGQGIEFDYSCVHAAQTLKLAGFETIMVNCNPETVSTDYDTSDRLYFEPLTLEDVLEVVHAEKQSGNLIGVIVQLGGQTPLGLAQKLKDNFVPIVGTSPEAIHLAEERGAFGEVLEKAKLISPEHGMASSFIEAKEIASRIGYPVLVRPSYVLGGRGMEIVYDEEMLLKYIEKATQINPEHPVLVDRFLDDALEIDVDALFDGKEMFLGGIMEHIEEAGVHSGDSACSLPPISLSAKHIEQIRESTYAIGTGIGVVGLMNVQYALAGDTLYVLEANPRASRTVPFVSKATGISLAKACARVMLGATINELRNEGILPKYKDGAATFKESPIAVKEAVLPFGRFRGVDSILGPEMKSTGEVMGIDTSFGTAFAKAQSGAYSGGLPLKGNVFVSIADRDKESMVELIKKLKDLGFNIFASSGTASFIKKYGIESNQLRKHHLGEVEGETTSVQAIRNGDIDLVVNTPYGVGPRTDGYQIRTAATDMSVPCITTAQGLKAALAGIESLQKFGFRVKSLQEWSKDINSAREKMVS
ncbi:MAG: carbamoyl-phosphate synthase large subunit, partial [Actinomycetes bacterium]